MASRAAARRAAGAGGEACGGEAYGEAAGAGDSEACVGVVTCLCWCR